MQQEDKTGQVDARQWALDLKVEQLTNAERAYEKSGVNLVMTANVGGKDVEFCLYLTKGEALDLTSVLAAQVCAEVERWPVGYSDAELAVWRSELPRDADDSDVELEKAEQVAKRRRQWTAQHGGTPSISVDGEGDS